jgi:hypothetical protein
MMEMMDKMGMGEQAFLQGLFAHIGRGAGSYGENSGECVKERKGPL